ncbi:fungal-specific transcription factor domain-containing protein [Mucidula mucida]|nr:fungal-specific transcription factor domain-containing protein [Mucidula mucida]
MSPVLASPLLFPPSDLIYSLVNLFLDTTNTHLCLLHGPSFRRDVSNGIHYTSRPFGSVVLAVCAIASRISNDPRVADRHQVGWEWFKQLRPLDSFDYASSGCLWDLQLFALMVLYMYGLSIADKCWLFAGMGIRLAQHMRIHRKRRTNKPWTPLDESLTRAWWALVTLDSYASSLSGRMRSANSDEFDTEFPALVDDEYWPGEFMADPNQPWTQPAGVVPKITAWVLHLKLLEIYGFAQKTIYSVRRSEYWDALSTAEWGHNVAVELDSALNNWVDAIPDHLRWNPHQPSEASAVLYSTYYWVQIQIHRPFIINADRSFSSIAICTNAARSCAHVLQAHHAAFHDITLSNMLAAMLSSAIVLLLNAANSHYDGAVSTPRDLEDVYKLMEMLHCHEEKWQVAGRY